MQDDAAPLQNRAEHLQRLARHLAASSALQGLRAGARASETEEVHRQLRLMQSSTIWRATWPVRVCLDLARGGSAEAGFVKRLMRGHAQAGYSCRDVTYQGHFCTPGGTPRAGAGGPRLPPHGKIPFGFGDTAAKPVACTECADHCGIDLAAMCKIPRLAKAGSISIGWACDAASWIGGINGNAFRLRRWPRKSSSTVSPHTQRFCNSSSMCIHCEFPVAWEVDDLIFDNDLFLKNRKRR